MATSSEPMRLGMSTARVVRRSVRMSKLFGIVLAEGSNDEEWNGGGWDVVELVLPLVGSGDELDEAGRTDDVDEAEVAEMGGEGSLPVVVAAAEGDVVGEAGSLPGSDVVVAWPDDASVATVDSAFMVVLVASGGGELVPPYAHPSPSGIEVP